MLIGWEVTANEDDSAAEAQIAYRRATAKQFDLGAILMNHHFAIRKLSKVPLKTLQDAPLASISRIGKYFQFTRPRSFCWRLMATADSSFPS